MTRALDSYRRRMARRARVRRLVALPLVLSLTGGAAWGYWAAGSVAGGGGAAAAASVGPGTTPAVSATGPGVTVSWGASTLSSGQAVSGYRLTRYDAAALTVQPIGAGCAGTLTALTCLETGVPSGSWKYSVTPVFATNWQGAESALSATVTSDATPPVNAITLSGVTGGAYMNGATVYYRGAAAGSFSLTNALTDAGSGPASSQTAALAATPTGWTHSPSTVSAPSGGPYTSTAFSWTAATTSAPTEAVTGRDVRGNTAVTTLSFVNDSTAPTAGTLSYADGYQPGRAVAIAFTAGADGGSGLAAHQLQRAAAPLLTGGTCGTFALFAVVGPVNPVSPYTDRQVTNGVCYTYRYVATDRVGNQAAATSASTARVDYAGAVGATPGVLSHWRLGESAAPALVSVDAFTGAAGLLTGRAGELGATWQHQAGGSAAVVSNANRVRRNGNAYTIDNTTATPPTADYSVEADLVVQSNLAGDMVGVVGRLNTANTSFYMARWVQADSTWKLVSYAGGVATTLSSTAAPALVAGDTYRLRLTMAGTALRLSVNGVLTTSATDSTFTAIGKAGIMDGQVAVTLAKTDATGVHLDNFQVTPVTYPRAADSKGTNPGDYVNRVTTGVAGAIAGDANTAAQLDGANDYVQVAAATGIPVGAAVRSVELWFKTTSAARQVLFSYGALVNSQEFGLWLNAGGTAMTAWGFGVGNDKTFTLASAVNNGAWHHVVKTYDGTSITLYVDGVALPAQAATRATGLESYGVGIGAILNPRDASSGGYFNGSLDEVSLYTTTLNQATVTGHHELGVSPAPDVTGPTGGSVDAGGLVGTGSRYAASTTLSVVLAKGADPSGLAATGAQLLRAAAPLTSAGGTANGVCGAFGGYLPVPDGTDPASPKPDTVADQACYRYQYIVTDTVGNATTLTSPDIKVDSTAPAAPTLAFSGLTAAYWAGGGSTAVYYRPGAGTGAFTATASASDPAAGIASHTFPALGAGWTSAPGSAGVTTYSWTAPPAVPGATSVTATNHAALTSAGAPFTVVPDGAPPANGTVTYFDKSTTATAVSVSFTTGTDAGSGVGARTLQRSAATLTGSTCGAFGAFATVAGGANPASPVVDPVTRGTCYQYRYVVADNVGNQVTATSPNVVKVLLSYVNTITGTAGLVSYWRLGEATTTSDSFTSPPATTLAAHTGELGATWTRWVNDTLTGVITAEGRLRKSNATGGVAYYTSAVPASADYLVEADLHVKSIATPDSIGVLGRMDLAATTGSGTHYLARYDTVNARWDLAKNVNGTGTILGSFAQVLAPGATYRIGLDMKGTTIRLLVDGVERVLRTDASVTVTGRSGVRLGAASSSAIQSDTQGLHLDNVRVTPPLADSVGTNRGTYLGGPTLGAAGAIATDPGTAARFDGVDDFGAVARQIADDFSIELWFSSTQGIGTGAQWSQGAGLVDADAAGAANDFGVALRADGRVVAGVGTPDVSIVSTAGGYNDGGWHHVVFTRTRVSGALTLYVDGVAAGSATGSTLTLTSPTAISFGRNLTGANPFAGALDEVALYSTVLPGPTAALHFDAGQ